MPQPIISDSRFLAEVEGNRYALIRLRGSLLHKCLDAQECLRNAMHGFDLVYPTPHLTLCNFRKEANLDEIRSVTSAWATRTPRFDVTILAVSSFPHPHQVIYASVRRNGGILLAHQTLLADVTKNGLLGELRNRAVVTACITRLLLSPWFSRVGTCLQSVGARKRIGILRPSERSRDCSI